MRLFVAVVVPEEVIEHLEEFTAPRREAGPGIRWTDPHQWHVTLAFLAAVPERRLDDLVEVLTASAARRDPLELRLAGAGTFPDPAAAKVLWAGVAQQRGDLAEVASGIRAASNSMGATPDGTRFHPHVTLGRFARPTPATRWLRVLDHLAGPSWVADELTLVESHLGEGRGRRPRYATVATLPLAPG